MRIVFYLLVAGVSGVVTFGLAWLIFKLSHRYRLYPKIRERDVHTRPMGLLGKAEDFDGSLWFFTDTRSTKLREMASGALASLVFQNDAESTYLQLVGRATEVRDASKMAELYTPGIRTWFPDGLADPHLTLVRFDAERGSFWDAPGGIIRVMAAFAKAVITGTPTAVGTKGAIDLG